MPVFKGKTVRFCGCLSIWMGQRGSANQALNKTLNASQGVGVEAVARPFAILPAADQFGLAQNLHVMGQGGLANAQRCQQVVGTFFTSGQLFENDYPAFVADGFEQRGKALNSVARLCSSMKSVL